MVLKRNDRMMGIMTLQAMIRILTLKRPPFSRKTGVLVCLFMALYFGRIRTRLGVDHFRVFRLFLWLLTTEFSACSKPPSRDNHGKTFYPRTQQRVRWEWELNLDYAIVIIQSP